MIIRENNNSNNIVQCQKCKAPLIQEELAEHVCFTKKAVKFMYDTGTDESYVFDGKNGIAGSHQPNCNNQIKHQMIATLPKHWYQPKS